MYRKLLQILFFCAAVFYAVGLEAATSRFSVLNFRPSYDEGPFFGVRQSQGLKFLQFQLGTAFEYAYKPLTSASNAGQAYNVVRSYAAEHFFGTFGISDWLELAADMPVLWHIRTTNPDTLAPSTAEQNIGDLQIELKARLFDNSKSPVGLAIAPFITVPTGDKQIFAGNDGATGGGLLILDAVISDRYTLAFNVGGVARKKFNAYGKELDSQLLLGFGAAAKIVKGFTISGEAVAATQFDEFFQSKFSTPVELRGGVKWDIARTGLTLGAAGGGGLVYGGGSPKYSAIGTLAWTFPTTPSKSKEKKEIAIPQVNLEEIKAKVRKTIHFKINKSTLSKLDMEALDELALFLVNNKGIGKILIDGWTDSLGPKNFNKILSKKRALSVCKYLEQKGVDGTNLVCRGHGELPPAKTLKEQRLNRKVEINLQLNPILLHEIPAKDCPRVFESGNTRE